MNQILIPTEVRVYIANIQIASTVTKYLTDLCISSFLINSSNKCLVLFCAECKLNTITPQSRDCLGLTACWTLNIWHSAWHITGAQQTYVGWILLNIKINKRQPEIPLYIRGERQIKSENKCKYQTEGNQATEKMRKRPGQRKLPGGAVS